MAEDIPKSIAEKVQGANLAKLQTGADETTDEDSFADLLSDIVDGSVSAEEVDTRIVALLNDLFDIPMLPENVERRLFGFAVDGVKIALVQVAERLR